MLSHLFVLHKSKNFTSDNAIRMPPTVPLNHYTCSKQPIKNWNISFSPSINPEELTKEKLTIKEITVQNQLHQPQSSVLFYYSMLMCSVAIKRLL